MATVFPLEGLVPGGQVLDSQDEPTMRASVLSRWPDGSASVVVISGQATTTAGGTRFLRLRAASPAGTVLAPGRVGQIVNSVNVSCGAVGTATLNDFSSPERVWWANEQTICCRYRVAVGSDVSLEAVIDIHAFSSNHALVEVVVENGKLNAASPVAPAAKAYTATLSVNGTQIGAAVASSAGPGGTHQPFRAWFRAAWVNGMTVSGEGGAADPAIATTHDAGSMQAHPLFFKCMRAGASKSAYATDAYTPWTGGRWPAFGMDAGGDSSQIGSLPKWDADYLQSGDVDARNGVIANALALLSFDVNYRDSSNGLVPTADQTRGKRMSGEATWPSTFAEPQSHTTNPLAWEVSHHGAAGLMAFLCRPSPVFIEIAQKIACFNGANMNVNGVFTPFDQYQIRGAAWCTRSLLHAIFVTPSTWADGAVHAWKAPAVEAMYRNVQFWTAEKAKGNPLGFLWAYVQDFETGEPGLQRTSIEDEYFITEVCKLAKSRVFTGARQTELDAVADAICQFPVRFVNEAADGEWRAIGASRLTVSSDAASYVQNNWAAVQAWQFNLEPPMTSPGPWRPGRGKHAYSELETATTAGAYYESYFWAALVAAVERDVPGAATAWSRVTGASTGISNLSSWADGFANDPRWGAYPRNKP